MRESGLCARFRKRWKRTTDSRHGLAVAENLLRRDFSAAHPGEKWVSDITFVLTKDGWLFLTVILDLFDRRVIGWCLANDLKAEHVCHALDKACKNRKPQESLLFHSDQGVQYCSEEFRTLLRKLCPTARQSMSRKGNCWDNACAESFFKTLKAEVKELDGKHTAKEVRLAIFEYLEIEYNKHRRHSALGYVSPEAFSQKPVA
jgi:transposase InsO family protein